MDAQLIVGVSGVAVALFLIFLRVPIGVSLALISIIGIGIVADMDVALSIISSTPYNFVGQ